MDSEEESHFFWLGDVLNPKQCFAFLVDSLLDPGIFQRKPFPLRVQEILTVPFARLTNSTLQLKVNIVERCIDLSGNALEYQNLR